MRKASLFISVLIAMALSGCATTSEKKIDVEMREQKPVYSQKELRMRGHDMILKNKNLTQEQRQEVMELYGRTAAKMGEIRGKMSKLKVLLFRRLLDKQEHLDEVEEIKARLMSLNEQKMTLMLDALDSARKVLGKNEATRKLMDHMYDTEHWSRM